MNRKDEHVSLAKAFHGKQKNEFDTVRIVHTPYLKFQRQRLIYIRLLLA